MTRSQWLETIWRVSVTVMVLIMFAVVGVHVANCP
jgi:hypothetical protein